MFVVDSVKFGQAGNSLADFTSIKLEAIRFLYKVGTVHISNVLYFFPRFFKVLVWECKPLEPFPTVFVMFRMLSEIFKPTRDLQNHRRMKFMFPGS